MTATPPALTLAEIQTFIERSAEEVFAMMLGLSIKIAEPSLVPLKISQPRVTALLGLTGEWAGSGQLSCDPALARAIAGQFLMAEYPEVNDEVLDATAELANMIIGNVKTALENRLGPMGLSTPVMISGDFETRVTGNPSFVTVPFECEAGNMIVQVMLSQTPPSTRRPKPVTLSA